jgi:uncharacterized small protein (DUF1192 family)
MGLAEYHHRIAVFKSQGVENEETRRYDAKVAKKQAMKAAAWNPMEDLKK